MEDVHGVKFRGLIKPVHVIRHKLGDAVQSGFDRLQSYSIHNESAEEVVVVSSGRLVEVDEMHAETITRT